MMRPATSRLLRNGLLSVLCLLVIARAPYAANTVDFSRDVFVAQRMLHGESFPLIGPILGGGYHLGPLWYYLLALLLALCNGSWLALNSVLAVLFALQVPLAYLAGKALFDRRAGVLWACALMLPSWGTFATMLPSHPTLAWPLTLAFLVCLIRWARTPRARYFYGAALMSVIALHAHPSTLAIMWVGIPVAVVQWRKGALRGRQILLAFAIVLLPFLPLLYWDAARGFDVLVATGRYTTTGLGHAVSGAWPLLRAISVDAIAYWFDPLLQSPRSARAAAIALMLASLAAAAGLVNLVRDTRTRRLAAVALATLTLALMLTCLLRDITPFYMTAPAQIAYAGLLALGLSALGNSGAATTVRAGFIAFVLATCAAVDVGSARLQIRGEWPYAWFPPADVTHAPLPTAPLMMMPAYAMAASGRFLCNENAPAIHGAYASQLLQNYVIEMRLACARSDVELGGSNPQRMHWLGLSRAMFARLDRDPGLRIGSIGLVRATPLALGRALQSPAEPRYPPYWPELVDEQSRHVHVDLRAGEFLAITDTAFLLDPGYTIEASIDGRPLQPRAQDHVSRVYACEGCRSDASAAVDIQLHSRNPDDLDAVIF